jgi:hypothetical protein
MGEGRGEDCLENEEKRKKALTLPSPIGMERYSGEGLT